MKIKNKILKIITMSKAELTYETYDMNTRYVQITCPSYILDHKIEIIR